MQSHPTDVPERQTEPRPIEDFDRLFFELTGPVDTHLILTGFVDLSCRLQSPVYHRRVGLRR